MKKWLKKCGAALLAMAMVVAMLPQMQTTVQAADKVEKKYWTDVAGLKEFSLANSTDTVGKVIFGQNSSGDTQAWKIAGPDTGITGDNIILFADTPLATGVQFAGTTDERQYQYDGTDKSVYSNHYGASGLHNALNGYSSNEAYFSSAEQGKMNETTIYTNDTKNNRNYSTTDKLYAPYGVGEENKFTVGTNTSDNLNGGVAIDISKWGAKKLWLRSPYIGLGSFAFVAIPSSRVNYNNVTNRDVATMPAFNLNLSSVIFASAANAASSDEAVKVTENTYILRYNSTTGESGKINKSGTKVQVKNAAEKFLVIQNNSGAYAKKINENDETITASQMGAVNFNDCEVWIESTDADRITTAKRIVDTVDAPVLTVNSITKTYDGNSVADSEINGTATVDGEKISGTWKFVDGQDLKVVNDSGTKNVIFTPTDTDMYEEARGTLQLTINKVKPTGSPKFTKITEAGKTLADTDLDKTATTPENGFDVPGTVNWDDDDSTAVEANKAYGWTFTPNDTDNYEIVKGSAIVYATGGGGSSSGGGGGGSSSGTVATPDTKIDPADAQSNLFGTVNTIDVTGSERSATSMQLADQTKKALGVEKFSTIILASGTDFPDGLGVSGLSIQQKAPVLIVTPSTEAAIKKYIEENLVSDGKVIISGGTGAVSQSMQNSLNGIDVTRLGGADRYATNLQTIKELLAKGASKDEVLIASGKDFADALSASATGKIIMIVGDNLTNEQKTLLEETGFGKITILGGTGAISQAVENQLNSTTGKKAERVGGANRIETSKLIAARYFSGNTTNVYTKADGFADGLAGGLLANITGSPMRLAYGAKDMTAGGRSITLGGVK